MVSCDDGPGCGAAKRRGLGVQVVASQKVGTGTATGTGVMIIMMMGSAGVEASWIRSGFRPGCCAAVPLGNKTGTPFSLVTSGCCCPVAVAQLGAVFPDVVWTDIWLLLYVESVPGRAGSY